MRSARVGRRARSERISRPRWLAFFVLFVALPPVWLSGAAVLSQCRLARELLAAQLARRVDEVDASMRARLAEARSEFASYVAIGFARLSTDGIAGRPGLGTVEARLRSPVSVFPLSVPFERIAISGDRGGLLWVASEPVLRRGAPAFASVRSSPAGDDTTGLAAVLAADGEVVAVPLAGAADGGRLRLLQCFRTDPYERRFVMTADLPLAGLVPDLEAAVPGGAPGRGAAAGGGDRDPPAVTGMQGLALAVVDTRGDIVLRASGPSSMPPATGPWHSEVLVERVADPELGIATSGWLPLRPHYLSILRRSRLLLAGAGLVILLGAIALLALLRVGAGSVSSGEESGGASARPAAVAGDARR